MGITGTSLPHTWAYTLLVRGNTPLPLAFMQSLVLFACAYVYKNEEVEGLGN